MTVSVVICCGQGLVWEGLLPQGLVQRLHFGLQPRQWKTAAAVVRCIPGHALSQAIVGRLQPSHLPNPCPPHQPLPPPTSPAPPPSNSSCHLPAITPLPPSPPPASPAPTCPVMPCPFLPPSHSSQSLLPLLTRVPSPAGLERPGSPQQTVPSEACCGSPACSCPGRRPSPSSSLLTPPHASRSPPLTCSRSAASSSFLLMLPHSSSHFLIPSSFFLDHLTAHTTPSLPSPAGLEQHGSLQLTAPSEACCGSPVCSCRG